MTNTHITLFLEDSMKIQCKHRLYTVSKLCWEQFSYFKLIQIDNNKKTDVIFDAPDDFEMLLKFITNDIYCDRVKDSCIIDCAYQCRKYCLFLGLDPESDIAGRLCNFINSSISRHSKSKMAVDAIETACGPLVRMNVFCISGWYEQVKKILSTALLPFVDEAIDVRNPEIIAKIYENTNNNSEREQKIFQILDEMYNSPKPRPNFY